VSGGTGPPPGGDIPVAPVDNTSLIISLVVVSICVAASLGWELWKLRRAKASPKPAAARTKLDQKRENERLKLSATFLNNTGIAVMLTAAVLPVLNMLDGAAPPASWRKIVAGALVGFLLHGAALLSFRSLRSED
jgi:hypothetical protein